MRKLLWAIILLCCNVVFASNTITIESLDIQDDGSVLIYLDLNDQTDLTLSESIFTEKEIRLTLLGKVKSETLSQNLIEYDQTRLVRMLSVRALKDRLFEFIIRTNQQPVSMFFAQIDQKVVLHIQPRDESSDDSMIISNNFFSMISYAIEFSQNIIAQVDNEANSNLATFHYPRTKWLDLLLNLDVMHQLEYKNMTLLSDHPMQLPQKPFDQLVSLVDQDQDVMSISIRKMSDCDISLLVADFTWRKSYCLSHLDTSIRIKDVPYNDILGALAILRNEPLTILNQSIVILAKEETIEEWAATGCWQSNLWRELEAYPSNEQEKYRILFKGFTDQPELMLKEVNAMIQTEVRKNQCQSLPMFYPLTYDMLEATTKWNTKEANEYAFYYIGLPTFREEIQKILDQHTLEYEQNTRQVLSH